MENAGDDPFDERRRSTRGPVKAGWGLLCDAEALLVDGGPSPPDGAVDEAVRTIERALYVGGHDPEVALAANLALAQVVGPRTADVDTLGLQKSVGHARRARNAAQQLGRPEPAYSATCSALGSLLFRLADRLPARQRHSTVTESLEVLRDAVRSTTDLDPRRVVRMANLAGALQAPIPSLQPQDEITHLDEAVEIYSALLDLGDSPVAALTEAAAHAQQRRAAVLRKLTDFVAAADAFDAAERLYSRAIDLGRANGTPAGGALMGLSRLRFELAEHNRDDRLLNEAIAIGQAAIECLQGDVHFEREAMMQLAAQFAARLRRYHLPSDAAYADGLSARALEPWLYESGSIELESAQNRRLDVLRSVTLSSVGTDAHVLEVDELLQELFLPDERTPQMEAFGAWASIARVAAGGEATAQVAYAELVDHANRFEAVLTSHDFVADDPAWWVRWFSAHRRISAWAEWVGVDSSTWLPVLADASQRMETRLSSFDPTTEVFGLGHLQLAEATMTNAILQRNHSEARRALDLLEIARGAAESLSVTHRVKLGLNGSFLCELLGDAKGACEWINLSRVALLDLEHAEGAPLAAQLAVDRERYELAGTAAALASEPSELAWVMHSTVHPALNDGDRQPFLDELVECSDSVTVVFLAQSRRRCRAAVLHDGQWAGIDLPQLAIDRVGELIKAAHRAHAQAKGGSIEARSRWSAARSELNSALAKGLMPLSEVLANERRPVTLRLSGWLHAVPVAPVLLAETGHCRAVAISLATATGDATTPRSRELVALAEPGDGRRHRYLAHVVDDVEAVAEMFDRGEAVVDATVTDAIAALTDARVVLVASHGASANEPELARLILHDADLTAAKIVELDLHGLDLVVIAACEALSTDRVTPEHPFSVQTALMRAGAAASCGPLWEIDDDAISHFTRTLLALVASGNPIAEAYRQASAAVQGPWPELVDLTLVVDSERRLCED